MRRVSIIIPTHNRPALLRAALETVRAQTLPAHEIIIVDDGSTAEHAAAVRAAADALPKTVLLRHETPRGPAAARNAGLDRATGDYVVFLDDDDAVHPDFFEAGVSVLEARPECGAAVFLFDCIYAPPSGGEVLPMALLFDYREHAVHPVQRAASHTFASPHYIEKRTASSFLRFLVPIHSCFVRRAAIGRLRFREDLAQGEDTYFWIALARSGCRFASDVRVFAYVRRHRGNMTRSRRRYVEEIAECYRSLLRDGLLTDPQDVVLAHVKLFTFTWQSRPAEAARHLGAACARPLRLLREVRFWGLRLGERRRLLSYYLAR